MNKFTAADGRTYNLVYDLPTVREIRKAIGIDLIGTEGIKKATSSIIDFAEVLWHTVRLQAERQGVSEEEFIRSLQSCLDQAADAWLKEISRFFDSIGRAALARLAESLIETERHDRAEANEMMNPEAAAKITRMQTSMQSKARRSALAKLIGEDSDAATAGEPLPS
jgi:hypothetical protein